MAAKSNTTVRDMTRQELNAWLLEKRIDKEYCVLLTEDQKIDGRTFVDLTEAELKSELSITKFGPRKQILRLIEEANEQDEEKPSMLCYSYDDSQSSNGATGLDADPEARGASLPYGTGVLWNKPILKVHFTTDTDTDIPIEKTWVIDGQPITTPKILELANEWSSNGRDCVPKFELGSSLESDIRVKFQTSGGSWSRIGSRAQRIDPSMVLNLGVGGNDYKKHIVRHEFGHALGLGHEHQSKNAPSGLLNREAVIDWLVKKGKMSKKEAEEKYEGDYKDPDDHSDSAIASPYDTRSIMQYWILPEWINKDHQYARKHPDILKNGINNPPQHTLSDIDTQEIVQHYKGLAASGGAVANVSADSSVMNDPGVLVKDLIEKITGWHFQLHTPYGFLGINVQKICHQASGGSIVADYSPVSVTDPGKRLPEVAHEQEEPSAKPLLKKTAQAVKEQGIMPPVDSSTPELPLLKIFDEPPEMRELQLMKWRKGGQEKHLRIIANTAPRWKELGTTLGISPAELEGFERQRILNQEECCRSVLQRWLENGSQPREAYPVTWRGLFEALRDTGKCGQIATDLKTALCQRSSSSDVTQQYRAPPAAYGSGGVGGHYGSGGMTSGRLQYHTLNDSNHIDVTTYLVGVDNDVIRKLGIVLGIAPSRMQTIDADKMVRLWFQRLDDVEERCRPTGGLTWESLESAMRHPTVRLDATANDIKKQKLSL